MGITCHLGERDTFPIPLSISCIHSKSGVHFSRPLVTTCHRETFINEYKTIRFMVESLDPVTASSADDIYFFQTGDIT